jgi:hypothetical protein
MDPNTLYSVFGPPRAPSATGETTGIRAYQGSPHDFNAERLVRYPDGRTEYIVGRPDVLPDVPAGAEVLQDFPMGRMRMDKIGTVEGAQAYGHGLYSAEAEGVAMEYRRALADTVVVPDGTPNLEKRAAQMALTFGDGTSEGAISWLSKYKEGATHTSPAMTAELVAEVTKRFESGEFRPGGRMYEININANPEQFLDWDMPLAGQTPEIQSAIRQIAPNAPGMAQGNKLLTQAYPQPGQEVAGEFLGETAARRLREAGIPGVRYLDAGSRGAGDGTRNFVVFDENLINIVRKYGIAGAATMLGVTAADVQSALADNMPQSEWESLVVGQ